MLVFPNTCNPGMTYQKVIVCFANSRKTFGRCIAGKEWKDGAPGSWIRPVSARPSHEVSLDERRYQDGRDPSPLDILSIPCLSYQPIAHQSENHYLDPNRYWESNRRLPWRQVKNWLDKPQSLWGTGASSYEFVNNRVIETAIVTESLYLIHVDELRILVGPKSAEYPKRIVRGEFQYNQLQYRMSITDPVIEGQYLAAKDGCYTVSRPTLCVSLGDAFQGFYYKLIAAVLYEGRFL
jgi:hypothetical protein